MVRLDVWATPAGNSGVCEQPVQAVRKLLRVSEICNERFFQAVHRYGRRMQAYTLAITVHSVDTYADCDYCGAHEKEDNPPKPPRFLCNHGVARFAFASRPQAEVLWKEARRALRGPLNVPRRAKLRERLDALWQWHCGEVEVASDRGAPR